MKLLCLTFSLALVMPAAALDTAAVRQGVLRMRSLAVEQQARLAAARAENDELRASLGQALVEGQAAQVSLRKLDVDVQQMKDWGVEQQKAVFDAEAALLKEKKLRERVESSYRQLKVWVAGGAGLFAGWLIFGLLALLPLPHRLAASAGAFLFVGAILWALI